MSLQEKLDIIKQNAVRNCQNLTLHLLILLLRIENTINLIQYEIIQSISSLRKPSKNIDSRNNEKKLKEVFSKKTGRYLIFFPESFHRSLKHEEYLGDKI